MYLNILLLLLTSTSVQSEPSYAHGVHLPLYRRGGSFIGTDTSNLTQVSRILTWAESRYGKTYTDVEGNRIVRRWQEGSHGADEYLLDGAGNAGSWYTIIQVGSPPQELEVDVDMLSPEFYTIMTTSGRGSKYDTFLSSSHEPSQEYLHPSCLKTTEVFHLPLLDSFYSTLLSRTSALKEARRTTTSSLRLPFPICQPPKYTYYTLYTSGSILGLSPTHHDHSPLSRLKHPPFLSHLLSTSTITDPLIHITLLTPTEGLLSLGTPPTYLLEKIKVTLEKQLAFLTLDDNDEDATKRQEAVDREVTAAMNFLVPDGASPDTFFTWTDSGAGGIRGWHTGMISGVWVNGVKVLKNQVVVFDVNCPVVLVPSRVGEVVLGSTGGRKVSSIIDDNSGTKYRSGSAEQTRQAEMNSEREFWAYPCLNVPIVEIEIGGWRFPIAGRDDFGMGRLDLSGEDDQAEIRTGYCVSVIVETDMGSRPKWARSGMKDTWVLGEPFFRSVGVVFDFGGDGRRGQSGRVGVRRY